MLTNEDIQKIISVVATKEDITKLDEKVDSLRETMQGLAVSVDKFVGAIDDLKQEYKMAIAQTDRHEKWIKQIAGKVGIQLEY